MNLRNHIVFIASAALAAAVFTAVGSAAAVRHDSVSGRFVDVAVGDRQIIPVYSLAQDSAGFVWIGTESGLYRHDGIRARHFVWEEGIPDCLCNNHVNVLSYDRPEGVLYVGTDRGFCTYNNAGGFRQDMAVGPGHVKTVLRSGDSLWIGTSAGLFRHIFSSDTTVQAIQDVHIASSCVSGGNLFFGTYGKVLKMSDRGTEPIVLKGHGGTSGNLVLALAGVSSGFRAGDAGGNRLFVGSEKGLYILDAVSGVSECLWNGGPVKNFVGLPDGSLVAGTDNGLLVLDRSGEITIYRHELGNARSIPDNVIWATMLDSEGGLWVGTDHGAAFTHLNDGYDFTGVESCGMLDGLDISSIVCTSGDHIYAAGMNGVLDYSPSGSYSVYKSDSGLPGKRLAHNKVRFLYCDGQCVWSASDGGLDRIEQGQVVHYNINEPGGKYLSDWMYAVAEDGSGRLWTGTYDGGLFITSKSKMTSSGGDVTCDRHMSSADGLSGDIVLKLCRFGNRMAAVTDRGVDLIDENSFDVTHMNVPEGKRTLSLASDGERLWIGTEAGVYALEDQELVPISGRTLSAQSMVCSDGSLWLCDDCEIWKCDVNAPRWQLVRKFENSLLSIAANDESVFAGSLNGFYSMSKSVKPVEAHPERIVITSLYLDNVLVSPGREYSGRQILRNDISLTDRIVLRHGQNSFALTFSPMKYPASSGRFAYRLAGFYDEWQMGPADTRAVFLNVPPGRYSFEVRHLDPAGGPDSETEVLEIKIRRPWYSTVWAYLAYLLIAGGCLRFALYFRKIMNQLKQERAEKEKAQSIANSTVSRTQEFRETLSVIFGSRQVRETESSGSTETPDSRFIKEIADIVNRHLDDPEFSAAALCEESHWPAKQIYRKIKQLTGLSTVEFIRDIRLQKAASLLKQGKNSVTEIMYMSGFTTASYFSKCFKARYGLTPSEYQRDSSRPSD